MEGSSAEFVYLADFGISRSMEATTRSALTSDGSTIGTLDYMAPEQFRGGHSTVRSDGTVRGYDGLVGAYLGLGIDEYGNFLNQSDNTATGYGYVPGRIGLRGRGSISWAALNKVYPTKYPSSLTNAQRATAVQYACSQGAFQDWSLVAAGTATNPVAYIPGATDGAVPLKDYAPIPNAYTVLSTLLPGKNIANESAVTRSDATPITYNLKITQDGLLSFAISYNGGNYLPVISKQSITASNGALPASFRFGFTGSTGGSTNVHEILCFQAAPPVQGGSSIAVNEKEATKVQSGTQAYLANYFANDNTGRLTASDLKYDATATPPLFIASKANWDASCNLTGVASGQSCITTQTLGPIAPQSPAYPGRNMLTWDGKKGVAFEWSTASTPTAITSNQQNTLDQGDPTPITADRLSSFPHELSGGMRQRVMIAMALALEPQVVILDEPTTALDVVTQREILEELTALRERLGFAVLFITHDLSLLAEIADSIAVMYAGRLVERAAADELFRAPRHPYTLGLLNSFPALHGPRRYMSGIPGSPPDLRMLPVGCVFHPRCPYAMDICREQSPPLEQPAASAGDRLASCWLQDGTRPVPAELAQPEPGAGQLAPSIAAPDPGSQS